MNPYQLGLDRNPANYAPLTPLTLLDWSASTYPDHTAVIYGDATYTWSETRARCRKLGSALMRRGIGTGDTVFVTATLKGHKGWSKKVYVKKKAQTVSATLEPIE